LSIALLLPTIAEEDATRYGSMRKHAGVVPWKPQGDLLPLLIASETPVL
jgi:hypothetical protein